MYLPVYYFITDKVSIVECERFLTCPPAAVQILLTGVGAIIGDVSPKFSLPIGLVEIFSTGYPYVNCKFVTFFQ